jgi:hypothetical protein
MHKVPSSLAHAEIIRNFTECKTHIHLKNSSGSFEPRVRLYGEGIRKIRAPMR